MGKRKKNQSITWNPLQTITIGKVKDNKYGWIGTIALFALFIAVIFYLPNLMDTYSNFMENRTPNSVNNTTNNSEIPKERVVEKYTFQEKNSFEFPSFTVTSIKIFSDELSYKVNNISDSDVNLSDLNYFFELYDESGEVIQTIYVTGIISKDASETYKQKVNNPSAVSKYSLSIIDEAYFTEYHFESDVLTNQINLSCTNDIQELDYTFEDEKLKQIVDVVKYSQEKEDYAEKLTYYEGLRDKYADKSGLQVSCDIIDNGLNYSAIIDYKNMSRKLEETIYFEANTSPKAVRFKMEAMGYSCS